MSYTSELIRSLEAHKIEMRRAFPDRIGRWAAMAFTPFGDDFLLLASKQEPLGEEFEKVLRDNLWDLYAE